MTKRFETQKLARKRTLKTEKALNHAVENYNIAFEYGKQQAMASHMVELLVNKYLVHYDKYLTNI